MEPSFDTVWRRRALAGAPEAVQLFADAALLPLYRFCFHRVGGNQHLCEEVVQETLMRGLRDLEQYDPSRSQNQIFPWLSGLARNEIHRVLNREQGTVSLEQIWMRLDEDLRRIYARIETQEFPDTVLLREETRSLVNATMSQLPMHYRQALEAKYVDGRSVRALADETGNSEKAIESLLGRARQAFRETFLTLTHHLDTA